MKIKLLIVLLLVLSLLAACQLGPKPEPTAPPEPDIGMANPASVHCDEQGGRTETRTQADGGEVGYCIFPDGSECEEWAYFRGECRPGQSKDSGEKTGLANPASVHCEEQGGKLDIRKDAEGNEVGYCVFADGSECEEWAFFRGECEPGQSQ